MGPETYRRAGAVTLPDFLTEWPGGEIVLTGHRINLYSVIRHYKAGYSPEMLLVQFPDLTPEKIRQVLAFYEANRTEVDAYVEAYRAEIDRQAALPRRGPSFEELKRRMAARRSSEGA
jgi:uncharacterized protein (DUF433 family)